MKKGMSRVKTREMKFFRKIMENILLHLETNEDIIELGLESVEDKN